MMTARVQQAFKDLPGVRGFATVLAAALFVIAAGIAFSSAAPVHSNAGDQVSETVAGPSIEDEIEGIRNEIKFQEYNWNPVTGEMVPTGDQSNANLDDPRGYLDGFESPRNAIKFLEYNPNFHPDDLMTSPSEMAERSGRNSGAVWPGIDDLDLVKEPRLHRLIPPEADQATN